MRTSALSILIAIATAAAAPAALLTIANPGFEDDMGAAAGNGGWLDNVPTGWSDPQGGDNTNFVEIIGGFAAEGTVHLGFDGNEFGMVHQDLGVAWAANTRYTMTVAVGNRDGFGAGTGRFGFGSTLDVLPIAGPAGGPYSLYTPSVHFTDLDMLTIASTGQTFADAVFTFETGPVAPDGDIRISIQQNSATRIHVDNIRLDATLIPEPSSLALLGLGLASALFIRRRRRA